jgi:hypothetical protein
MGLIHFACFCSECSPTQDRLDRRWLEPALLKLRFVLANAHPKLMQLQGMEFWYSNLVPHRSPDVVLLHSWENELGDISKNTSIRPHETREARTECMNDNPPTSESSESSAARIKP